MRLSNLSNSSVMRGLALVAMAAALVFTAGNRQPVGAVVDSATQVQFIVNNAECGGGGVLTYQINGVTVATSGPARGCACGLGESVITVTDPAVLATVGASACSDFTSSTASFRTRSTRSL